ncbi:MAG: dihydroorotase family protein [Chloroflexota bacterium]
MSENFDLLVKNVQLVRPNQTTVERCDIGIKDGKFVEVGSEITTTSNQTIDANGLMAFPGAVDAHMHIGIYRDLSEDAQTESRAAAQGGVTTTMTYIRSGSYYLNMGGSWRTFFPEVLCRSEGNYWVDYAYHVSPIESSQIEEMEYLAIEQGAPNFGEVFMFYGSHGLHGRSDNQRKWLMLPDEDNYDVAHFEQICRMTAHLQQKHPDLADQIAVSFHCETPEILRVYEKLIHDAGELDGLEAWSAARPPHSEAVAIAVVGALAHAAGLQQVNILHITSQAAMEASLKAREAWPDVTFGLEVAAGHLLLDTTATAGPLGKVNPPLRSPEDREFLWQHVLDGTVEWIITDHAACPYDMKVAADDPTSMWKARAGFGGTEYLLAGIFSEGTRRGLSPNRVAELVCWNPARRFGLTHKGDIAAGFDADLVLFDPNEEWVIDPADSESSQEYTPFAGLEVKGKVKRTFLRGEMVFDNGRFVGEKRGKYVKRPS